MGQIAFVSTPNGDPNTYIDIITGKIAFKSVTWTVQVTGEILQPVQWTAAPARFPDGTPTKNPLSETPFTFDDEKDPYHLSPQLNVVGQGMATITATLQSGHCATDPATTSVSHGFFVAAFFKYGLDYCQYEASSTQWTEVPPNNTFPDFVQMTNANQVLWYDPASKTLLANYATLGTLGQYDRPTQFFAAQPAPIIDGAAISDGPTYAYGPDGTLWCLNEWTKNEPPDPLLPSRRKLHEEHAQLAWEPDKFPSGPSIDDDSNETLLVAAIAMCYILDQSQIQDNNDQPTFYTFEEIKSNS